MEKSTKDNLTTVQGVMTPVPAALGSARAGYQSSISSACNVTPVSLARVTDNATSNHQQSEKSPFVRSSAIKRTPPTILAPNTERTVPDTVGKEDEEETKHYKDTFVVLGDMIVDLMEYVKNRNNVHHAIKEKVRTIRVTYNKVRDERAGNCVPLETNTRASQTSPKNIPNKNEAKRSRDPIDATSSMETPKRPKKRSPKVKERVPPKEERATENPTESINVPKPNMWMTAGKKKKKRPHKQKPDTMIISAKGDATYADILKKIRTDPELIELGDEVNKVRRTQKGDLILELKSTSQSIADKFNDKIKTCLDGSVEIKTHTEETVIECKDLDDITTKQEICLAFAKALEIPDLNEKVVKSIRKSYGGTQIAKLSLPLRAARKAVEMGKIKIGWSICRIRETISLTMCYRCLEYGHTAKFCKTEADRSRLCRRCGAEGHISKECEVEPNCMLCKSNGDTELKHIAGSYRCPVFKKALSDRYK